MGTSLIDTSSVGSFYTAEPVRRTIDSTKNSLIELNGVQYHLTVYHKKSNQQEWKEVTNGSIGIIRDKNFQQLIQQIKQPCDEIEIEASIYQHAISKNSIHCVVTENGNKRKINLSINKPLLAKIFQVFENSTKSLFLNHTNNSVCKKRETWLNRWVQDSVSKSKKPYDSLFAKSVLEETKKDPEIRKWLEEQITCGQKWKELHEKCTQPDVELTEQELQSFSYCLMDFSGYQILEKEELLQNIKTAMDSVKTELKIVAKPAYKQVLGFTNKSNNCGFNSCLQMILNEPVLFEIYETVANHYCSKDTEKDRSCGQQMLSVFKFYQQALKKQAAISSDASNNLRLALHYLSPDSISAECTDQEDANEILIVLFLEYEKVLQEENLLNRSLIHHEVEHIVHHKIEKPIEDSDKERSALSKDNTLIKKTTEWNLKIKFKQDQNNFKLIDLLKSYFCDENLQDSESRKLIKDGNCVLASMTKEEIKFSQLPKHLFINLERFKPNLRDLKKPFKVEDLIDIPEELDAKLLNVEGHPNGCYELRSFIVHRGTLKGGHYVAYRKVENQWVECNDGNVSSLNQKDMLSALKSSYICFYDLKEKS